MLKLAIKWIIAFELCALFFTWRNLRAPWIDPMDGSTKPTPNQVVLMTHASTLAFFIAAIVFVEIFKRVWRASNRRR